MKIIKYRQVKTECKLNWAFIKYSKYIKKINKWTLYLIGHYIGHPSYILNSRYNATS